RTSRGAGPRPSIGRSTRRWSAAAPRSGPRGKRAPSADQPARESEDHADEATHHRSVEANELEVGADAFLDLCHQPARLERFQVLANGPPDLVMVPAEQLGKAEQRSLHHLAERVLRVSRRRTQLGRSVAAGGIDESPLHEAASQHEGNEPLSTCAQRARRAVEPPVELSRGARALGQVSERKRYGREGCSGPVARDRATKPGARRGIDGQLPELALERSLA